jgi:hypothetical protein
MRPYRDDREHLLDELARLDARLRRYVASWRAETGGDVDELGGLYVSDERVDRLLAVGGGRLSPPGIDPDARSNGDSSLRERIDELAREIGERERATAAGGTEPRLVALADRFGLDRHHVDALLLALAPELDRKYEAVYGYLQDNVTLTRPTVDLALRVLFDAEAERLSARRVFAGRSPLRRHRLIRLGGDRESTLLSRPVAVDERVVTFLLGEDDVDEALAGAVTVVEPGSSSDSTRGDPELRAALEPLARTMGRCGRPPMVYLHGPYGVGRRAAVESLCAESGTRLLRADVTALARDDGDRLGRLLREARLQDASVAVEGLELPNDASTEDESGLAGLVDALDSFGGPVFLIGVEELPIAVALRVTGHDLRALELARPSYERRRALWAAVDGLPSAVEPADLAAKFRLTGGQIADAVVTAERVVAAEGGGEAGSELTAEAVYRGCRAQSTAALDTLARKVDPGYTWADIVLPADEMAHLREVAAHVRHQGTVYSDWGFAEKFSLGNGLTVLFSGPSGTGKTMAAEIIAGDAGLDLYKIDLAGVVSKYIGETEKNLGRIFDAAADSSAILLFDEADALFGKRSTVRDAHDRYANIEVNYLLQRIEEHDGTVLLTTNFEGNIDNAFRRRIHLHLTFPRPDRESREAIWRGVFPERTPVGDLDVEFLSTLELAGGNIKNIALTAAFLAADGDDEVGMEHVVRAARREFQKTGRLIDPKEFGEFGELLG